MKSLRIATRKSLLALWQAEHVAGLLESVGAKAELVPMVSGGDTDMRPIDGTRQAGVFTKRIQRAVLDDEADVAVHSLKDLPTDVDPGLTLVAVPQRETVHDCLVSPDAWTLSELPEGARIGTGSRRRAAQLLSHRPDLRILPIRGNVQTRLQKLQAGEFDAIMLAEAGIVRLQLGDLPRHRLTLEEMLPAPGQGALGIEVRAGDSEAVKAVSQLDDVATRAAVTAERAILASLHGGCLAPIAALGELAGDVLRLGAVVLSQDGKQRIDHQDEIGFDASLGNELAVKLADSVSEVLRQRGAVELIQQQR